MDNFGKEKDGKPPYSLAKNDLYTETTSRPAISKIKKNALRQQLYNQKKKQLF